MSDYKWPDHWHKHKGYKKRESAKDPFRAIDSLAMQRIQEQLKKAFPEPTERPRPPKLAPYSAISLDDVDIML